MNCLSHYILHSLCCPQQKLFSRHVWYLQIHTTTTSSSRHINLIFSWLADQKSVHFKIPLQFSCLVMHKTHSWPKKRLKRVGDPLDLFRPVHCLRRSIRSISTCSNRSHTRLRRCVRSISTCSNRSHTCLRRSVRSISTCSDRSHTRLTCLQSVSLQTLLVLSRFLSRQT